MPRHRQPSVCNGDRLLSLHIYASRPGAELHAHACYAAMRYVVVDARGVSSLGGYRSRYVVESPEPIRTHTRLLRWLSQGFDVGLCVSLHGLGSGCG